MLEHLNTDPANPSRVVILGRTGFVASNILKTCKFAGIPAIALGRENLDLTHKEASQALQAQLRQTDSLVFVSAIAPSRDAAAMTSNMRMVASVAQALSEQPVSHVVNISSDAVYSDTACLVHEGLPAAPTSSHGVMHRSREVLLTDVSRKDNIPIAHLRPSLLYGLEDPHNGYGPNRFRRQAQAGETIRLFGQGEEQRDHVAIEDVARIVVEVLRQQSKGTLNVATGRSLSFRNCAELAIKNAGAGDITGTPRQNPIIHRQFDVTARLKAFPAVSLTRFETGFQRSFKLIGS